MTMKISDDESARNLMVVANKGVSQSGWIRTISVASRSQIINFLLLSRAWFNLHETDFPLTCLKNVWQICVSDTDLSDLGLFELACRLNGPHRSLRMRLFSYNGFGWIGSKVKFGQFINFRPFSTSKWENKLNCFLSHHHHHHHRTPRLKAHKIVL